MMTTAPTVYVISGASRGIGFAITSLLAQRENVLIFAGTRDTSKSIQLNELAQKTGGKVFPVKLESADEEDAAALAKLVDEKAGKVDVLYANAGIAEDLIKPTFSVSASCFLRHFNVNTLGTLVLFQHMRPLLLKSSNPRLFVNTSLAGSTTLASQIPINLAAYGVSKAAVNHLVVHIAREHEQDGLTATLVHPGHVATDMSTSVMRDNGLLEDPEVGDSAMISPEESAAAIVKIVDEAKRETHGGKFLSYDGSELPW